jgi:hypothetical protein
MQLDVIDHTTCFPAGKHRAGVGVFSTAFRISLGLSEGQLRALPSFLLRSRELEQRLL